MGTTYSIFHKDVKNLKLDFYVIPQKYDFYPFNFSGRFKPKWGINYRLKIYKNILKEQSKQDFL